MECPRLVEAAAEEHEAAAQRQRAASRKHYLEFVLNDLHNNHGRKLYKMTKRLEARPWLIDDGGAGLILQPMTVLNEKTSLLEKVLVP